MIHAFVNDPVNELGKIAQTGLTPSGRWNFHVNKDGSCLLQSVSDIVLEKVVRIAVPKRIKRFEDPTGNNLTETEDDFSSEQTLKTWIPSDSDNIFENVYKLRDYAKWFSNYYSLAQFHRLHKDFELPESEEDIEQPAKDCVDLDKVKQDAAYSEDVHEKYIEAYSTIRIFRDGSILLYDAYGSAITMAGGNVQISASKHLQLEAAGDINLVAGNSINAKAYDSVELSSTTIGKIYLRGYNGIEQYSDAGVINIQSDADPEELEETDSNSTIKLSANKGNILAFSKQSILLKSLQETYLNSKGLLCSFLGNIGISLLDNDNNIKTSLNTNTLKVNSIYSSRVTASILSNKSIEQPTLVGKVGSVVIGLDDNSKELQKYKDFDSLDVAATTLVESLKTTNSTKGFEHKETYSSKNSYETLTQQNLKNLVTGSKLLNDDDYDDWYFATDSIAVAGAENTYPWPGSDAKILTYTPTNNKDLNQPSNTLLTTYKPTDNDLLPRPGRSYSFKRLI